MDKCKWCNSESLLSRPRPDTPHYAEIICKHCGKHNKWIPNPEKSNNRLRANKQTINKISKFHNFDKEFCFFCLRKKEELGQNETMTIDHIQELDKGGKDEIQNMQIFCSACHKLKNWSRLYMNWHFKKEEEDGNSKAIT